MSSGRDWGESEVRGAPGLRGRGPGRGQGRSRGAGWISRPRPPGLLEVGSLSSLGSGGAEREAQRILPAGSAVSAGISGEVRPVSPAPPRPKALSTPARLEGTAAEMEMGSGAPDGNGPTTLGFCGSDPQRWGRGCSPILWLCYHSFIQTAAALPGGRNEHPSALPGPSLPS